MLKQTAISDELNKSVFNVLDIVCFTCLVLPVYIQKVSVTHNQNMTIETMPI